MPPEQRPGSQLPDAAGRGLQADQALAPGPWAEGSADRPTPGGPSSASSAPAAEAPPAAMTGMPVMERKVFRLPGAIVAWWAWVIFAAACLGDIAFTGRNHTAAEIAVTVLAVTGVVYACALRPRVVADSSGITVQNPFRDHLVPWGSVTNVDLAESVRVHCVTEPVAKRAKVIHSWALYSQRRQRLRSEMIGRGDRRRLPRSSVPSSYGAQADAIAQQPAAEIMAKQLDELARDARGQGAPAGPRVVTWAWRPAVAIVVPAILLVLVVTVFR
jgi:hypothetical protein